MGPGMDSEDGEAQSRGREAQGSRKVGPQGSRGSALTAAGGQVQGMGLSSF